MANKETNYQFYFSQNESAWSSIVKHRHHWRRNNEMHNTPRKADIPWYKLCGNNIVWSASSFVCAVSNNMECIIICVCCQQQYSVECIIICVCCQQQYTTGASSNLFSLRERSLYTPSCYVRHGCTTMCATLHRTIRFWYGTAIV